MLRGFPSSATVRFVIELEGGRGPRFLSSDDLTGKTSSEATGTEWWQSRSRGVDVQIWRREMSTDHVELTATCAGRNDPLSTWVWEVRIPVSARHHVSWPYSSGAVVPVDQLARSKRTLELTYPVYASMQWIDVYGGTRGCYVGAHDPTPWFKHLRVHVDQRGRRRDLVFEIRYTDLQWPCGREWLSPPLVIAGHPGDWREGASIYRAWADTWFSREPSPEIFLRCPGHNMISFPSGGGRRRFSELPEQGRRSRRLGVDSVHIADWMEEGFDTFYPAYRPDKTLGGEAGLRRAVGELESHGVRTSLYFNGRLLDPVGPHGGHAFDWAVKLPARVQERFAAMWERTQDASRPGWDPRMATPPEPAPYYPGKLTAQEWWLRTFAVMCPWVNGWRQLWLARVRDAVTRIRPQTIQVDQVCGCWGMPCYDDRHGHPSPALAWSGYREFTRAMRANVQAVVPDIALWSEGVNDILGQAFDGLQTNLGFDSLLAGVGRWDPRIFKSTFPEYVLLTGDLTGRESAQMAWALITGSHGHYYVSAPERLGEIQRRRIRFMTRMRSRYWRAFTSTDVFVPDVEGDESVCAMGYRLGRRILLVGAPVGAGEPWESAFRIRCNCGSTSTLLRSEWFTGRRNTCRVRRSGRCDIAGAGPFVLLLAG
jgi:hypothetical protein